MEPEGLEGFVERLRRIFGDVFQQCDERVRIRAAAGQGGDEAVPPDAHGADDGKERLKEIAFFIRAVRLPERDENLLFKPLEADRHGFCEVDGRMADAGEAMARAAVGGAFQIGCRACKTFLRQDAERGVFGDQADVLREQLVQRGGGFRHAEIGVYQGVADFIRVQIAIRQGMCRIGKASWNIVIEIMQAHRFLF